MVLGNFELDFEDGEIRFKTSVGLGDRELGLSGIEAQGNRGAEELGSRGAEEPGGLGSQGATLQKIPNSQTPPPLRPSRPSASPPLCGLIQELVYTNVMVMDEYLPGIWAILETDQSPHAAIQAIETKTAHIEG